MIVKKDTYKIGDLVVLRKRVYKIVSVKPYLNSSTLEEIEVEFEKNEGEQDDSDTRNDN